MKEKLYKIRLSLLLKKYDKQESENLNLSGAGWQDYASASERSSMYNEAASGAAELADIRNDIVALVQKMMENGMTYETIVSEIPKVAAFKKYIDGNTVNNVQHDENVESNGFKK